MQPDFFTQSNAWYCNACWKVFEAEKKQEEAKKQEAQENKDEDDDPSEDPSTTYDMSTDRPNMIGKGKRERAKIANQGIKIGTRVYVKDKEDEFGKGTIKYIGKIDKKVGLFAGIELDQQLGKHDGFVFGKRYFKCQQKHGIFTQKPQCIEIPLRRETNIKLNDRVTVMVKNNVEATVKYIGAVDYAPGLFFGIALDEPQGMHDGLARGKRYFSAKPKCGMIVSKDDIERIMSAADKIMESSAMNPNDIQVGQDQYIPFKGTGMIRYVGNPFSMNDDKKNDKSDPTQIFVGLEMQEPNGNTDGMLQSLRLFQCAPKHGLFKKLNEIILIRTTIQVMLGKLYSYPHCNVEYEPTFRVAKSILDFSQQLTQPVAFQLLQTAMDQKSIEKLQHAITIAANVGIPPSAPKLVEAKKLLAYLHANGPAPQTLTQSALSLRNGVLRNAERLKTKINLSMQPIEKNPKSLAGRTDPGFFRLVQLFFIIELFSGGTLIGVALYDSVWVGFPLFLVIGAVTFIVLLDYFIMYKLAWTRRVMEATMVMNICALVLFLQTLSSGFGKALQLPGFIFLGTTVAKLIFMKAFKRQMIGARPKFRKKNENQPKKQDAYEGQMNVHIA